MLPLKPISGTHLRVYGLDVLHDNRRGVFYPLQTLLKTSQSILSRFLFA
jgi:hypothetical protein